MFFWTLPQAAWVHIARSRAQLEWLPTPSPRACRRYVIKLVGGTPHYITALSRHPYPSTPVDDAIFEAVPDETTNICAKPRASAKMLIGIINQKQLDLVLAERVRKELASTGQEIRPHPTYARVAAHVLKHPSLVDDPVAVFSDWLSLIPGPARAPQLRNFARIRDHLYCRTKVPHLQLVMKFAIITASRGYKNSSIAREAIKIVIHYTKPSVSAAFLSELSQQYPVDDWLHHHNFAVKTYCLCGRVEDGFTLFEKGLKQGLYLRPPAYRTLHCYLRNLKQTECLKFLESHGIPSYPTDLLAPEWLLAPKRSPSIAVPPTNSLVDQLRFIKGTMRTLHPPSAKVIAKFAIDYKATGRSRALHLLFSRARSTYGHGMYESVMSNWILAEMTYFYHVRNYRLVLFTFAKHFYLVGVPIAHVLKQLDFDKEAWKVSNYQSGNHVLSQFTLPQRLFPNHRHTALVWHALVALNPSGYRLEALYEELVHESLGILPEDTSLPIRPPSHPIDAAHFTPFVKAFSLVHHRTSPVDVLRHMSRLGGECKPQVWQISAMLGAMASVGKVDMVLTVLDRMEKRSPTVSSEQTLSSEDQDGSIEISSLPAPDLVTYTSIISGFTRARQPRAAYNVYKRMMARDDYVPGEDVIRDEALEEFEDYYSHWHRT